MGIDRANIPEEYMCERCQPRWVDKHRARSIQLRKKEEFFSNDTSSDSSTSTDSEPLSKFPYFCRTVVPLCKARHNDLKIA